MIMCNIELNLISVVLVISVALIFTLLFTIIASLNKSINERDEFIKIILSKDYNITADKVQPPHTKSKHDEVLKRWRDSEVRRDE